MTEPVSLHSFCKENGNLPKTSVRRWLNDNGYSTSNGLNPAAVEAALVQFCPAAARQPGADGGVSYAVGRHQPGGHRGTGGARLMGYLSDRTQQNLAWLATGAAALMLTTGGAMVLTNPQLQSRDGLSEAYRTGRLRQEYQAPQAMTGRVAGYLLAALGLSVGLVGGAAGRQAAPQPYPYAHACNPHGLL